MSMWFGIALAALLIAFGIGFYVVKSGRLTYYILALDSFLISMQALFEHLSAYDFTAIMSPVQQGWLVLTCTVLAIIARARRAIRERMSAEQ